MEFRLEGTRRKKFEAAGQREEGTSSKMVSIPHRLLMNHDISSQHCFIVDMADTLYLFGFATACISWAAGFRGYTYEYRHGRDMRLKWEFGLGPKNSSQGNLVVSIPVSWVRKYIENLKPSTYSVKLTGSCILVANLLWTCICTACLLRANKEALQGMKLIM